MLVQAQEIWKVLVETESQAITKDSYLESSKQCSTSKGIDLKTFIWKALNNALALKGN